MSWLSRVRNGIPFLPKRQSAENLWHKCSKCGTMVFVKEWEENYNVCPRCNFHDRIGPTKRFEQLFDAAEYELLPAPEVREDPLRFRDTKRYTDRLKTARAANRRARRADQCARQDRRPQGRHRRAGFRLHGRIDGHCRRRRVRRRRPGRDRRPRALISSSPPPAAHGCRRAS